MRRTLGVAVFSGMIGVTLFGIFLTPVFFYVIDWSGEAKVFHWGPVQFVSGVLLDALSARPLRRLARHVWERTKHRLSPPTPLNTNGQAKPGAAPPAPVREAAPEPTNGNGAEGSPAPTKSNPEEVR
jgi:multidrug efflux pump